MIKTILITGSGGFVGGNLKKYLEKDYTILSPRSYELDCTSKAAVDEYFKNHKIDFVIHCGTTGGARGIPDKESTIDDNLKMVDNLLGAKDKETRIILFGSGAMYGKSRLIVNSKESEIGDYTPEDLYGQSKMLIAQKVKDRKDVVCLNIFACYGYDELQSRFPTYAITQNLKHLPIEINQNVRFDYLFIEDLCKIIKFFMHKQPENNIINVTPDKSVLLSEIADLVNEISDYKSDITIKNPILGNEYTGDNSRLHEEMPEIKFTSMRDGLKKLYNYIKAKG